MTGGKAGFQTYQVPLLPRDVMRIHQDLYASVMSPELLDSLVFDSNKLKLNPDVTNLKRYAGRVPEWWPLPSKITASWPLYLYYGAVRSTGQLNSAQDIFEICTHMFSRARHLSPELWSDAIRQMLKSLSGWAFPFVFSKGPAFMLFCHLHALTGKAPYTDGQILDDITSWVSDVLGNRKKQVDEVQTKETLDRIFTMWYRGEPDGHLTFEEFCADFMRWGTSGGAGRTELFGTNYRTKWAWAYSRCVSGSTYVYNPNIYSCAREEAGPCKVALKEEAQKTREIITTSMASYLRQSYLMYRWGKPRIPSPISSSNWLAVFLMKSPKWYGSVDGESFDRSVPAGFIRGIIERLGKLDPECAQVAVDELKELERLQVEWKGQRWDWRGGLLSGWRLTSVIGSLLSCCVADYIIRQLKLEGQVEYGVMGDDLIFYSNIYGPESKDLVEQYTGFGLKANLRKTAAGYVGEFLRKTLSMGGAWGYPALGLHSLAYANPWISTYTYEEETEVSSNWFIFFSRLIPHCVDISRIKDWIHVNCVAHLRSQFGKLDWSSWLKTPISAGGGGTSETSDPKSWVSLNKRVDLVTMPKNKVIAAVLGILKRREVVLARPDMVPIVMVDCERLLKKGISSSNYEVDAVWKHSVNISETIFSILNRRISLDEINRRLVSALPRSLRVSSPRRLIDFLMNGIKTYSGISSISHTPEVLSRYSYLGHAVARMITTSKRFATTRNIQAAVTMYVQSTYGGVMTPYGTL